MVEGVLYTVPYCIKESYKKVLVYSAGDTCLIKFLLNELSQEAIAELTEQRVNVTNISTGDYWTEEATFHSSTEGNYIKCIFSPVNSGSNLLVSLVLFFGEDKLSTLPIKLEIL